jgi:hypothetical protein
MKGPEFESEDSPNPEEEMTVEQMGQKVIDFLKANHSERFPELINEDFEELVGGLEVLNEHDLDINDAIGEVIGLFEQVGLDATETLIELELLE